MAKHVDDPFDNIEEGSSGESDTDTIIEEVQEDFFGKVGSALEDPNFHPTAPNPNFGINYKP